MDKKSHATPGKCQEDCEARSHFPIRLNLYRIFAISLKISVDWKKVNDSPKCVALCIQPRLLAKTLISQLAYGIYLYCEFFIIFS